MLQEAIGHETTWAITKYADEEAARRDEPYEVTHFEGNYFSYDGMRQFWEIVRGEGSTPYSYNVAYIGVGDSSAEESNSDTALQGTNQARAAIDDVPAISTYRYCTYTATFGSGVANFAWREFGLFNASTGGTMLNRRAADQGNSKTSGQVWKVTLRLKTT